MRWSDRAWLRAVGTDSAGVEAAVEVSLARWDGDDLLVAGYDLAGQRAVQTKRSNGKRGGRPKKDENLPVTDGKPVGEPKPNPLPFPTSPLPPSPSQQHTADSGSAEPAPATPVRQQVQEFENRYPAEVASAARDACELSRRSGKMSDSVWLTTLRRLAALEVGAVVEAMRTMSANHADGDKDEKYLIGIARRLSKRRAQGARSKTMAPVATDAEWDTYLEVANA